MMFRFGFLLCITIGVRFVNGQDPATNSTKPANLEFSCDKDGKISISLPANTAYKSIYAIGTKAAEKTHLCTVKENVDAKINFEISDCDPDNQVTVFIMHIPNQNQNKGHTAVTPQDPTSFIIGGEGILSYTLECFMNTEITKLNNVLAPFYVTKSVTMPTQSTIATKGEDRPFVDMTILRNSGDPLGSLEVHIGDPLLVLISGPAGPWYRVQKCRAYQSNKESNSLDLINEGNEKTETSMMMSSFAIITDFSQLGSLSSICSHKLCIRSTLHAFHFIGDNSVTLECIIEVCKDEATGGCNAPNKFKKSGQSGRRRRDGGSLPRVITSTIVVHDRLGPNDQGQISYGSELRSSYYLTGVLIFLWKLGIYA